MALSDFEILTGLFSLIFVSIAIFISLLIASKYRKYKQDTLLYVGLSLLGLAFPFLPSSISFLVALYNGVGLHPQIYFLIGNAFIPITVFLWMLALTKLIFTKHQKLILIIYAVTGIIFEIYLLYYLFTDYTVIGKLKNAIDVEYYGITRLYLLFVVLTIFISTILFSIECFKGNKELKLKGKFLLFGISLYVIGAIADGFITLNYVTLPIIRIILIVSTFMNYNGWILSEKVKKLFIKEE